MWNLKPGKDEASHNTAVARNEASVGHGETQGLKELGHSRVCYNLIEPGWASISQLQEALQHEQSCSLPRLKKHKHTHNVLTTPQIESAG